MKSRCMFTSKMTNDMPLSQLFVDMTVNVF
jgi:hypothetical protein